MDPQPRLQLANRIHLGLMRELGQGIDVRQMLDSALYARDVLLVCQAYPATELARLAEQFRQASAAEIARRATQTARDRAASTATRPGRATGFDDFVDSLPAERSPARRWLVPSTWFARG
jgi:hypothetical protein